MLQHQQATGGKSTEWATVYEGQLTRFTFDDYEDRWRSDSNPRRREASTRVPADLTRASSSRAAAATRSM